MRAERYDRSQKERWDEFVATSRNATFLHFRDYMDYHSDRFEDASLMFYDDRDRLCALLPASAHDGGREIRSHGGLTYGGFIMANGNQGGDPLEWLTLAGKLYGKGTRLIYKAIPHIYHRQPAEEDLYAIWRYGGAVTGVNLSAAADLSQTLMFSENARRQIKRAQKQDIRISESVDYGRFWPLLSRVLAEKHNACPVHTLVEIEMLSRLFPNNIRLVVAESPHGELLGGAVFYVTDTCVHAQYIAAVRSDEFVTPLPLLFHWVAGRAAAVGRRYLDFGTSNEDNGNILNEGLIRQKYGMGGRGVAYITCELTFF